MKRQRLNRSYEGPCKAWRCINRTCGEHGFCRHHRDRPSAAASRAVLAEVAALVTPEAIQRVPEQRLRDVLTWRWLENLTLQQIGDRLGVTRERARQLHDKALGLATLEEA